MFIYHFPSSINFTLIGIDLLIILIDNSRCNLINEFSGLTPNAFIGLSRNHDDMQQLHVEEKGFAAAKTLYISDSVDKRKHFDLYCKVGRI
jgi:hypothetical protein